MIPLGMVLALAASEARAQFRDYNGCISFSYKAPSHAEFYKILIRKVPFKERREVARQPAGMESCEIYGLEVGAPYEIEIIPCRQGQEGEVCDPPDVFRGSARLPK